jgi:hypothetical protein
MSLHAELASCFTGVLGGLLCAARSIKTLLQLHFQDVLLALEAFSCCFLSTECTLQMGMIITFLNPAFWCLNLSSYLLLDDISNRFSDLLSVAYNYSVSSWKC